MAHDSAAMGHGAQAAHGSGHEEHPPTTIKQYVLIGVVLTVITIVELWLSYSPFPDGLIIALLLILSAVKFGTVVMLFMHLQFDSRLFRFLFFFGLTLASVILLALIALFWTDPHHRSGPPEGATTTQSSGH